MALRRGMMNTVNDLTKMMKSDNYNDKIIAESVLEQLDMIDIKPGDGVVQVT